MCISGLGARVAYEPSVNAKTSNVTVPKTPDLGADIVPQEAVNILAKQIAEIKGGIEISSGKASPNEIQDSGAKLSGDCSSNEKLKTHFKSESFEAATGIEPKQALGGDNKNHQENASDIEPHLGKVIEHKTTASIGENQGKAEMHDNFNKDAKIVTAGEKIVYGITKIGEVKENVESGKEIAEHVANGFEKSKKVVEKADDIGVMKVFGVTTSCVGGIVNSVSLGFDISEVHKSHLGSIKGLNKEITNTKEEISNLPADSPKKVELEKKLTILQDKLAAKIEKTQVKEEIKNLHEEIRALPKDSPERAELEKKLDVLQVKRDELTSKSKNSWLDMAGHASETVNSGFQIADVVCKTVGPKVVPCIGLVVAGVEIAKCVTNIVELSNKKQVVKAEINEQKAILNNPNSSQTEKEAAQAKLVDLNKEKKGLNKEIRQEIISGGLSLASAACGFIPGAGTVIGAGISLVQMGLEKHWDHKKEKEEGKK